MKGVPRVVEVLDKKTAAKALAVRDKADPDDIGSIGAPMSGEVVAVKVKPGVSVTPGQQLVVMSAMKMETAVCAPCPGTVAHVAVVVGDTLDAADLLVQINREDTSSSKS